MGQEETHNTGNVLGLSLDKRPLGVRMSEIWNKYIAKVSYEGETREIPVETMSVHEVEDHARIMAGFEYSWPPSDVTVAGYEPDSPDSARHVHDKLYEIGVRPEGGEEETYTLKARDAECAEGIAVLHCSDKTGLPIQEIDVVHVTPK